MMTRAIAVKPILVLSLVTLVLAGCSTRLNPLNWFGNSRSVEVERAPEEVNPLLPRERNGAFSRPEEVYAGVPIDTILDLRIERTRTGAIILVEGLAARQGPFDVELTPDTEDEEPVDGVLSYTFNIVYPSANTPVGPEATRRITVARSISTDTLGNTRVVRVTGERNARETRRR